MHSVELEINIKKTNVMRTNNLRANNIMLPDPSDEYIDNYT